MSSDESGAWKPGRRSKAQQDTVSRVIAFQQSLCYSANLGKVVIMTYSFPPGELEKHVWHDPGYTREDGKSVFVTMKRSQQGAGFNLDLTSFTMEELLAFQMVLLDAIEEAKPIVQLRDEAAQEAERNGNLSYERSNRGSPKISKAPRKRRTHS